MAKIVFLFPGQGSQYVGMGRDLYESSDAARVIFDTFNRIVTPGSSTGLTKICFEGPEEELKRTLYTQPAILATSLAALEIFRERTGIQPTLAAGHSLGEYGALYAAGVIDLETAAKLVQKRAELMEGAPKGAMSVVIGLSETQVEKIMLRLKHLSKTDSDRETVSPVTIANYNTGDQYVISGTAEAVAEAGELLKEEGARRVMPLPVGGAFHSPLMNQAAEQFEQFIKQFDFNNAQFPVITNVDAQRTTQGSAFREKLSDQINHSVRWTQSMQMMFVEERVDTVIEFGPKNVLTGMVKKMYPDVRVFNIENMASLEGTIGNIKQAVGV
jgi:[acyl-carrier-protein] S-malonyltransferase